MRKEHGQQREHGQSLEWRKQRSFGFDRVLSVHKGE
jgi:hypothetical protein